MIKRVTLLFIIFISSFIYAQDVELNRINAKDEYKWGVRFFNQGLYEKSVFSFERSLSFDSLDLRTHLWLGNAYYMKGDVDAALEEWEILNDKDEAPLWLEKNMEIISAQRGVLNRIYSPEEWVTLYDKSIIRPSSILTMDDGRTAVVSFLGNTITVFNSNGARIATFNGGFEAFNRPFDIIEDGNGGYIVSEFMGDKISFINALGIKVKTVNPEESPLSGPGYLTKDDAGYFYVSDWGNRRVCKFDMEGKYILSISDSQLGRPSGIISIDNRLFVADAINNKLFEFDNSGNLIDIIINEGLNSPEGLSLKEPESIIIADGLDLKEFNISSRELSIISDLQGDASRVTKGSIDVNGNTLAVDFNLGKFYSLTDISSLYGGLYIVIDRVINTGFPNMQIELQVYNRLGFPVIGLDNSNFLISENSKIVPEKDVLFRGSDNRSVDMSLIVDMDSSMKGYLENFYDISKIIEEELESDDSISLVKAGALPEIVDNGAILDHISDISIEEFKGRDGIDFSIKLAASSLLSSRKSRELILVTDGHSTDLDFKKYSLNEISDFLKNNRISLSILYVEERVNDELEYLVGESGGSTKYLFSGLGPKGILSGIRDKKSGFYVVEYDSLKHIDNGEVFTTVEVEVNFIRKSGRSESGFFVPVKVVE